MGKSFSFKPQQKQKKTSPENAEGMKNFQCKPQNKSRHEREWKKLKKFKIFLPCMSRCEFKRSRRRKRVKKFNYKHWKRNKNEMEMRQKRQEEDGKMSEVV